MFSTFTHYKEGMRNLFHNIIIREDNKKSKPDRARGKRVEKNMQEKQLHFWKRDNFLTAIATPEKVQISPCHDKKKKLFGIICFRSQDTQRACKSGGEKYLLLPQVSLISVTMVGTGQIFAF